MVIFIEVFLRNINSVDLLVVFRVQTALRGVVAPCYLWDSELVPVEFLQKSHNTRLALLNAQSNMATAHYHKDHRLARVLSLVERALT